MHLDPTLRGEHLVEQRTNGADDSLPLEIGADGGLVGRTVEYGPAQAELATQRNHLLDEEPVLATRIVAASGCDLFACVTDDRVRPHRSLARAATCGVNRRLRGSDGRIVFNSELFQPLPRQRFIHLRRGSLRHDRGGQRARCEGHKNEERLHSCATFLACSASNSGILSNRSGCSTRTIVIMPIVPPLHPRRSPYVSGFATMSSITMNMSCG